MIALSINLNKIALIRNSRSGNFPDLIAHARMAIEAGADGITVHPRPDQRHIRVSDIFALKKFLQDCPAIEFNIEGNPFALAQKDYPGFLSLIEQCPPHQCTLVPDTETQLTSDHGFDLIKDGASLKPVIGHLQTLGIRVSLFMDPNLEQISCAAELGADRIELYTGPFAAAYQQGLDNPESLPPAQHLFSQHSFEQHCRAAEHAHQLGLGINAGHDLNLENLRQYRLLPHLQEVSIGHALTVDALRMGFAHAIAAYKARLKP